MVKAPKVLQHFKPTSTKGVVQTSVVYIGIDKIFTFLDNLEGGMIQKVGINIPILQRVSVLDALEYLTVAGGAKLNMDAVIGFFVTKFLNYGVNVLPFGPRGTSTAANASATVAPTVQVTTAGAPI